ncbi:MAG: glycosyltransferase family 2 protein [Verrucomicrobia bacterium]|nr:glycosyltransferase family 2 protein [Verrucomicrobiota bacterium]
MRACLESVRFADEIIVVDSESTDETAAICREMGVQVFERPFDGFGQQKNAGIDRATGQWILNVDADERVPETLRAEIRSVIALDHAADGYRVARRNYVGDIWIRHGGWYPDYTVRLFRRARGRFGERTVHEAVEVNGQVATLREALEHRTCRDFEEFARRQDRYAKLAAAEMAKRGRRATALDLWFRPSYTFLRSYLLRGGFLDGANGWKLACIYMRYTRSKYQCLRTVQR